jgi:hypothetical protein
MSASAIQASSVNPPEPAPPKAVPSHGFSFHDLLSALNPLQYLPVVGTIYRAATGDVIPEGVRYAGSMIASGLLGGPVGVVTSIAVTLAEKATGIDPEKIVAGLFQNAPTNADTAVPSSVPPASAPGTPVAVPAPDSSPLALSPQQLAAYGVHVDRAGTLHLGDIHGADVLNSLELARLNRAAAAYAASQSVATQNS